MLSLLKNIDDKLGHYSGPLAEPIYEPIMGLLGELMRPQAEERAREQQLLKLQLLFDWYGIDTTTPSAWAKLALSLAAMHVPGMKVVHEPKPRRGRKRTWQAGKGRELIREVEVLRAAEDIGISEAIRVLRSDPNKEWKRFNQDSLVTRHREAARAEGKQRALAKALMTSSDWKKMGGIFGLAAPGQELGDNRPPETDEIAS